MFSIFSVFIRPLGFLYCAAGRGLALSDLGIDSERLLSLAEVCMRSVVFDAQVQAGMWVRNGLGIHDMVCVCVGGGGGGGFCVPACGTCI